MSRQSLQQNVPERPGKDRAAPLPPTERRAAIIAATLPLLLEHGPAVTTRQIAEAAGIAEGTIFRVFPDIESLFQATVDAAYDPAQVAKELASIGANELIRTPTRRRGAHPAEPIDERLATHVDQRPAEDLLRTVRTVQRSTAPTSPLSDHPARAVPKPAPSEPGAAAQLLRGLTLAGTHPALMADGKPMDPDEIVSLLLDGLRNRTRQTVPG